MLNPWYLVFNHSTQGPPTDGSTVFAVSQCHTGCDNLTLFDSLVLNLTNIPTFILDVNATAYEEAKTWQFAFLACRPNAVIQTREVISNGTGFLEILPVPNGKKYISQGNLHPTQTPAMLSFALSDITLHAGPTNTSTYYAGGGTTVQAAFLFGQEQIDNLPPSGYDGPPVVVTILPTDALAQKFAAMLQSASKRAQTELHIITYTLTLLRSLFDWLPWNRICSGEVIQPQSRIRVIHAFYHRFYGHVWNTFYFDDDYALQARREIIHAGQRLGCPSWFQPSKLFWAHG